VPGRQWGGVPGRQWRGDRYNVRGAPSISTVRLRLPRLASAVAPCPGRRSRPVSNYNLKIIMTFAVLVIEAAGAHDDGAEISTSPGVKQALQPDACDGPEATVPHSAGALSSSRPTCIASFDARNMCRSMRSSIANHRLIVRSMSRPQGFARHTQWGLRPVALSTIIASFTSPHRWARRMPTRLSLHWSATSRAVCWGVMRADASQKRDVVGYHSTHPAPPAAATRTPVRQ